jgi:cytoplasmic iron level regulating protein YaaA (DUF328/UPF0246 family)
MLIVVSPAKNLDYQTPPHTNTFTQPELLDDAQLLIETCKQLTPAEIGSLMKISDKLADLNAGRYQTWSQPFTSDNAKQAVLAFNGDVYTGLDANSLSADDLNFAQQHMRILSGLYGLLKPLDLMQPYRLEMGTKLKNDRGDNLYQFWGDKITQHLNHALQAQGDDVLINLASNEYFKSVNKKKLAGNIIDVQFKDAKNGQYKVISFFAKKARGMMARYIIENRLETVEQLTKFDIAGYYYSEQQSSDCELVFLREQQ